ncbi:hypothetical protein OSC27_06320 [Microbacterium sp. STN6]|uniref:hypothetical protein n=1 Tax=Microbacterium sp. STN6 TaxID=2995588 RepID=UPI002260A1D8|nr:hypothetical protein [Microbacterium sp. STN6]MCX7521893.1 hypothetical protein [Microbacterium sp. STN6]
MFKRRRSASAARFRDAASSLPPLGIGALVVVTSPAGVADEWEGQPSGVIVATGDNQIVGYPGMVPVHSWLVDFDELAYMKDGRGPFQRATIASRFLSPVPDDVT